MPGPPMTPPAFIEAGCGRCHLSESVAGAPVLSRGRALIARAGCYACHAVRGQDTFRSEAPPLATLPLKTGGEWLKRWLKDPKSIDPNATMPNFHLTDQAIDELSHFLFAAQVPKELAGRIEAAAAEPPGSPANGKKLVSESRCITCHTVEGKGKGSAPELSKIASTASRGWLLAFLREPQAFNPRTPMPRYHFSETESRDVVAFLEDEFRDFDAPKEILEPLRVNQSLAENGRKLFRLYGCFSCHDPAGSASEKFGPELDGIGDKRAQSLDFGRRTDLARTLPAWLAAKLESPRSFADGLKMPSYGFSADDSRAVITALLALGAQSRAGALPVRAAAEAGAPARGTGRRPHPELPLPLLPPDRRPGRRRLDRPAHLRGKQGQARLARRLPRCSPTRCGRSSRSGCPS